jgi:multiple sugar transport system substrate-binding protein
MKKRKLMLAAATALSVMVAGCGNSNTGKGGAASEAAGAGEAVPSATKQPVELSFYLYSLSDKDFVKYYQEPLKEKFPNVTVKGIVPQKGQFISELVTAGTIPDVVIGSKKAIEDTMLRFDMAADIGDLIKKYKFDIGKLNPALIDSMKSAANGAVIGLPLDESKSVLYYNKDLFDKFGVAYPKDGMTWDDMYELAKKMTRTEGGIQYRGYSERYHDVLLYSNPFGISPISRKEEKGSLADEKWKLLVDNIVRFYTLPGLSFDEKSAASEEDKNVFVKGQSAMQIFPQSSSQWTFNWDVVSIPAYKEAPNVGTPSSGRYNFITKTSPNRDAAFEVITYLTSQERQLQAAKDGIIPALKMNDALMKAFKENDPMFKGKNIGAYFKYQYGAEVPPRAQGLVQNVDTKGITILSAEVAKIIAGNKDMNTAFRDAEEAINKELAAEKAKVK